MTSTKTDQDLALVREIIGADPLDFARWAGGELVIILSDGRKLVLKDEQINQALESGQYKVKVGAVPADAGCVVFHPSAAGADTPTTPTQAGRGRPHKEKAS